MTRPSGLAAALQRFTRVGTVLIVCDYDGTLAALVDDPDRAVPDDGAVEALTALAALPDTHVAVVSGRSLRDLAALCPFPPEIHLVGSHGSEYGDGFESDLEAAQIGLLEKITDDFNRLAAADAGFIVETKPTSVAFHYRKAGVEAAADALTAVRDGPAGWQGVRVKEGKKVIELAVIDADKGTAVDRLRSRLGAEAVLFVGDDVTDEDAFAVMTHGDVGIKVGAGETLARYRLLDTGDVAGVLSDLLELRRAT